MKKFLLILSVMLLSVATLFAAQEMSVTWEWLLDDPAVNYYRYQLNGTDDNGWTVVSGTTSSYLAEGLDPYQDHTLYLERSYDGVHWSETASATAEALLVKETAPAVTAPVETEEVVAELPVEVESAEVEAAPVTPIDVKAEDKSSLNFSLLLRPTVEMGFNWKADKVFAPIGIGGGVSLDFDNVIAFGKNSGLGIRFDIGSTNYAKDGFSNLIFSDVDKWDILNWHWKDIFTPGKYYHDVNADLLLTLNARAGFVDFSFGLGGGVAVLFNNGEDLGEKYGAYQTWGNDVVDLGAFAAANLGVKFYMGSVFSLGLDAVYKVYFPNWEYNGLNASMVLGFTF